ncbi:MAG TPA: hypothetical protein VFZ27_02570 [Terriglobia bacterium]|nr:hypothetical protein [Terriglobia bacterium]
MAVPPAHSQQTATVPSLGEIARQLRAERATETHKPVATYTNENLPSGESPGLVSVEPGNRTKKNEQSAGKNVPGAENHGEKYFRSKRDKIRSQIEFEEHQLAALKQQLGVAQTQYYPDPQKTLEQESTPAFRTDVEKLRAKVASMEKALANDQKAMDDLQQEVRRAGGDPGWLR